MSNAAMLITVNIRQLTSNNNITVIGWYSTKTIRHVVGILCLTVEIVKTCLLDFDVVEITH